MSSRISDLLQLSSDTDKDSDDTRSGQSRLLLSIIGIVAIGLVAGSIATLNPAVVVTAPLEVIDNDEASSMNENVKSQTESVQIGSNAVLGDPVLMSHGDPWDPYTNPNVTPPKHPKTATEEEHEYCKLGLDEKRGPNDRYRPDCSPPSNHFATFYSDIPLPPDNITANQTNQAEVNLTHDLQELQSITELTEASASNPSDWANVTDLSYLTTHSLLGFVDNKTGKEWTLGDYRRNQIEQSPTNDQYSYELLPEKRPLPLPEPRESGVIRDAYTQVAGIDGAAWPHFSVQNEDGEGVTGMLAGNKGEIYTFVDYWLDPSRLPETVTEPPVTSGSGETATQTQTRFTYHIENHSAHLDPGISGDEEDIELGSYTGSSGGVTFGYHDILNSNVTFSVPGNVSAEIYEYEWERNREKKSQDEYVTFTDSETVNPDLSEGECTNVTVTMSEQVEKDFLFADGESHRTSTVSETWEYEEEVCEDETPKTLTDSVTEFKTYTYWNWWNKQENQDTGGWNHVQNSSYDTDTVNVSDFQRAHIIDNQDINFQQTAVEIPDARSDDGFRYHVDITLEPVGVPEAKNDSEPIPPEDVKNLYLWSMLSFGNNTVIESPFRSYSYTTTDEVRVHGNDTAGSGPYYDDVGEKINYTNQFETYIFGQNMGPQLSVGNSKIGAVPELYGWKGSYIGEEDDVMDSRPSAYFEPERPVYHSGIVVKNVPNPVQQVLSVNEDVIESDQSNTKIIEYREPNFETIEYNEESNQIRVRVVKNDGSPLRFREVSASVGGRQLETKTTDSKGVVIFPTCDVPDVPSVHVEVAGDDPAEIVSSGNADVYYGSIKGHKIFGGTDIMQYLFDAMWSLFLASPLVLWYLLWRDAKLGE